MLQDLFVSLSLMSSDCQYRTSDTAKLVNKEGLEKNYNANIYCSKVLDVYGLKYSPAI